MKLKIQRALDTPASSDAISKGIVTHAASFCPLRQGIGFAAKG